MENDSKTKQFTVNAVPAQTITANGTVSGPAIIDTKLFESLTVSLIVSTHGGTGTHTLLLEAGDDPALSDAVDVLVTDVPKTLIGEYKGLLGVGINRIGYIGKKRFVRAKIITTLASSLTGIKGVVAIQTNPQNAPTKDQ